MNDNQNNESSKSPFLLEIIAILFAVFALGIVIFLVFFSRGEKVFPEQAIYWFVVSLIAAIIPRARELE
jgi:uncharacterized membrane protein